MPNWKKVVVSGSDAILNNITASTGIEVGGNILPDSDNTLSLGSTSLRFQLNGGTPVTVTGSGTANTLTRFQSATTVEDSNIFSSDTLTRITHGNDGNTIFLVSGSNGELLSVSDDDNENIFRVNDGNGLAIFEISSSGYVEVAGDVTASNFFLDDFGNLSASLANISGSAISTPTLQQVTDQGSTTTTNLDVAGITGTGNFRINRVLPQIILDNRGSSGASYGSYINLQSNQWNSAPVDTPMGTFTVADQSGSVKGMMWFHKATADLTDIKFYNTQFGSNYKPALNISSSGDLFSSGSISGSDAYIDGWGSVSASLASIESTGSSQNLQQVTDNGNTTTNDIIISGSITISGSDENLTLTGGSGSIETDHTTTFSSKKTIPNNNTVTVFSVSQETYVGGVVEYTFFDNDRNNMRSGIVTMVANSTATRHSELVTTDIGNTDNLEIQVVLTDSGFGMRVTNNTGSSFTAVCNVKVLKE